MVSKKHFTFVPDYWNFTFKIMNNIESLKGEIVMYPNFMLLRQTMTLWSPFVADSPDRRNNSAKNIAYFLEWAENHRTFALWLRNHIKS